MLTVLLPAEVQRGVDSFKIFFCGCWWQILLEQSDTAFAGFSNIYSIEQGCPTFSKVSDNTHTHTHSCDGLVKNAKTPKFLVEIFKRQFCFKDFLLGTYFTTTKKFNKPLKKDFIIFMNILASIIWRHHYSCPLIIYNKVIGT
uniref:Uncharacterized protein n=1 Tax=Cacopsylla melanoneura TaxID=428564 RepID=A0A8D9AWW3_9HEMI